MATHNFSMFSLLPLLFSLMYFSGTADSAASGNFIRASCKATEYPAVCVQSLSAYASAIQKSPRQLALTALSVSQARVESMMGFVAKLAKFKGLKAREYGAIKDCMDEMGDSVDRIRKSVRELNNASKSKGKDFLWHMSNVETWVSAALTDENTCMDGFSGRALDGKIKSSIRARVTNVAQVTSNALALVNQFAGKN
ncbi:hypothetical protein Vadar_014941 [Vaccinium darrowii]|uniref:Uncharacterized protein n=1 Tax=Vaccinium darrowii TaxID=229202 RepID=A0ACB7XHK8_9ERIC|nr:hypothetical protein Vadar_014941 [Vaccinium darrowii]